MTSETVVMWFRRDLRLGDHAALEVAARAGRVLPLFVVDPVLMATSGAPRAAYLHDCLAALDASLDAAGGGSLVVRHGDPAEVVPQVAEEAGAASVVVTRDHGPYGRRRDEEVSDRLRGDGRRLRGIGSNHALEPGTVRKDDGDPYAVFTPFSKRWTSTLADAGHVVPGAATAPDGTCDGAPIAWVTLDGDGLPQRPDVDVDLPPAGEAAARERWAAFRDDGIEAYDALRNDPAADATSHLSPHLKWGAIHPARLLHDMHTIRPARTDGPYVFASELAWRDFYADVLCHRPHTAWSNLRDELSGMELDTDDDARRRFARWCDGRTGFPIVDAGMRQLLATGWMHNRVRMIAASFLVKDLHLPWQWGARHFLDHLVDGDLASNNHGWQWAAGTGTDAAPYFRVFNPTTQFERFDPDGRYVARWIDEYGVDTYPAPMLDHAAERREALVRYAAATGRS
ncbi:MAG: deoxyribodipyrimidine photo-lyase [Ilumatobacteraceae bacterium]